MTPLKNNAPLTISEVMLSSIKFGNQIGGIIHTLASYSCRHPRGVDISAYQTNGESGKELIYPILYIWNFIYSLPSSTIQPELGSVLSPSGGAEAVD